jgi:hypothetical protein
MDDRESWRCRVVVLRASGGRSSYLHCRLAYYSRYGLGTVGNDITSGTVQPPPQARCGNSHTRQPLESRERVFPGDARGILGCMPMAAGRPSSTRIEASSSISALFQAIAQRSSQHGLSNSSSLTTTAAPAALRSPSPAP